MGLIPSSTEVVGKLEPDQKRAGSGYPRWYSEGTPELVQQKTTRSQRKPKLVHQLGARACQEQKGSREAYTQFSYAKSAMAATLNVDRAQSHKAAGALNVKGHKVQPCQNLFRRLVNGWKDVSIGQNLHSAIYLKKTMSNND
ncbi:hypothetical protein F511_29225 [Dorcoceras hygrometricum]|uniref:Uncharacterized protein n=1 Tax=Dorcoceras hygrometricum TaxID=472368 RepID=A0A2Z7DDP8_9LAMI|nr:hypothetical protein F511_29225 [Dorcoceras hygrometricum]